MEWLATSLKKEFEHLLHFNKNEEEIPGTSGLQMRDIGEMESEQDVVITNRMKEVAQSLAEHPETWENFPQEMFPHCSLPEGQTELFKFTPRQVRHAQLILEAVPALAELRFRLTPTRLSEEKFWQIYFLLTRRSTGVALADEAEKMSPENFPLRHFRFSTFFTKAPRPSNGHFWRHLLEEAEAPTRDPTAEATRDPTAEATANSTAKSADDLTSLEISAQVREGIPGGLRPAVWRFLTDVKVTDDEEKEWKDRVEQTFGPFPVPWELLQPFLHSTFSLADHSLSDAGGESLKRVVWELGKLNSPVGRLPWLADWGELTQ